MVEARAVLGTDCDEEPTQMLSINGEDAVEVSGSSCSTLPLRSSIFLSLFALSFVFLRRKELIY